MDSQHWMISQPTASSLPFSLNHDEAENYQNKVNSRDKNENRTLTDEPNPTGTKERQS